MSSPKKKVITTVVTCTRVPRPLRNLRLNKKKSSSSTALQSHHKSQDSSAETTSRSISLSGYFSSPEESIGGPNNNSKSKVIPPDEYYCESPPSGFGSSESSSRPLTGTPSTATEIGTSVSVTPSSSSAKDSAVSVTTLASSSPVGSSNAPCKGNNNSNGSGTLPRKDLILNSKQQEDDSGQGDYEEELQFSLVSSSSNFDLVSQSEETEDDESGSYSYSYTCSNSCCTTGCYSDGHKEDDEENDRSRSRSTSGSRSQSKRTISELDDCSDLLPSDIDEYNNGVSKSDEEEGGDSDLEKDREASDKTFELYLKRVEKLKKVLSHWDTFLNENGISRPDFFCRFKERESLQQIVEEFQKITSRHREGLLSALHDDKKRQKVLLTGFGGLGNGVDLEDTTSGSSDTKIKRNGWRNRRIRKLLTAGESTGNCFLPSHSFQKKSKTLLGI
jgi:hypothetical protein